MIRETGQKDRGFAPNRRTDKVPPPSAVEKLSTGVMCPRYPSCEAWKPAVNLISGPASVGALFERCGSICVCSAGRVGHVLFRLAHSALFTAHEVFIRGVRES